MGVLKAGGAYVPLDPGLPRERLEYMVEDAGVEVMVVGQRRLSGRLGVSREVVVEELEGGEEEVWEGEVVEGENLAYVMYTSGSTGRPKGVGVTRRGLGRYVRGAGGGAGGGGEGGGGEVLGRERERVAGAHVGGFRPDGDEPAGAADEG